MGQVDNFNAYIGSKSGVFKGVGIGKTGWLVQNLQSLVSLTDTNGVTALSWGDDEESEVLIGCGTKSIRSVKVYNRDCSSFTCSFFCNCGEGRITGISRYQGAILTSVYSGEIKLWSLQDDSPILFNAGENLEKMRHSRINRNIIATGGEEHYLKLFDLETKTRTFLAKNIPHDKLQLKVPVWISDIRFLPATQEIVTIGRNGHVCVYDPRTQRRPVYFLEVQGQALTALSTTSNDNKQVLVGSGRGILHLIDMRKPGSIVNTYCGFRGAITGVACSKKVPQVVTVSLDRYLRVHHMHTKQLLQEVYLTSRLSCMLLRSDFEYPEKTSAKDRIVSTYSNKADNAKVQKENITKIDLTSDSEMDIVFEKMQKVEDKENQNATGRKRKESKVNDANASKESAMKADEKFATTSKRRKKSNSSLLKPTKSSDKL